MCGKDAQTCKAFATDFEVNYKVKFAGLVFEIKDYFSCLESGEKPTWVANF